MRARALLAVAGAVGMALVGLSGTAVAQIRGPVVLSARAVPGVLPPGGGKVEVTGVVRDASSCRIVVLRDDGVKVSLPDRAQLECPGGHFRGDVGFGPSRGKSPVVVKLGLVAGTSAPGPFYVVVRAAQPGAVKPSVLSARAVPWQLPSGGGVVVIQGRVHGAQSCRLAVLADSGVRVILPGPVKCSDGAYSARVAFGANPGYRPTAVKLGLFPEGLVRELAGVFFVSLAGRAKPAPPTTTTTSPPQQSAPSPATTAPPASPAGGGYIPPLPPTAPLTTTTVPATTTTVPVTTTTAPTTTTTTAVSNTLTGTASSVQQLSSNNWSGYDVAGPVPYTSVTGTFTVTGLTQSDSCNSQMSEWAGIDGVTNTYLIQAGVAIYTETSGTGQCDNGTYGVYPWWEVITPTDMAPSVPISTWNSGPLAGSPAVVHIGDTVTVKIDQVANSNCTPAGECWQLEIVDDTTSGAYSVDRAYSGPGSTAEWVVENPDQVSNTNCPNENGLSLCPMPDYTPSVSFSGLSATPDESSGWSEFSMVSTGCTGSCPVVSQPSSLSTSPNLNFSTSYSPPPVYGGTTSAPLSRTVGSRVPASRP